MSVELGEDDHVGDENGKVEEVLEGEEREGAATPLPELGVQQDLEREEESEGLKDKSEEIHHPYCSLRLVEDLGREGVGAIAINSSKVVNDGDSEDLHGERQEKREG